MMLRGIKGTYVYVCDPKLRAYFAEHIPFFNTHSASPKISSSALVPFVNSVPVYSLRAAAGQFSEIQKVEDHAWIEVPSKFKVLDDLFACQVEGESMNKVIPNGSTCLFRKYTGGSRNGKIVLAELTNFKDAEFGSCYTVKEYQSTKSHDDDGWSHTSIVLKPLSVDEGYANIEIQEDDLNEVKIIGIFECVLK
jgi:SOS-response transcriptional repressor LexA